MYLYTPIDGRSIVIGEYIISSTGMQFDTPIECLEEELNKLVTREEVMSPLVEEPLITSIKPIITPIVEEEAELP